jgi:hypothetical protein
MYQTIRTKSKSVKVLECDPKQAFWTREFYSKVMGIVENGRIGLVACMVRAIDWHLAE